MSVTNYSSLDTGAPRNGALTGRLIDVLRDILVGALVTGYGSEPAAGWTLAHNHADGFTLGNGLGYINFVHYSNNAVEMYLLDSLSDTSTALVTGVNRRSYRWSDSNPGGARHGIYTGAISSSYTAEMWSVVADNKTAIVQIAGVNGGVDTAAAAAQLGMYFGQLQGLVGPINVILGGSGASVASGFSDGGMLNLGTCSRNPLDGTVSQGTDCSYAVEALRTGSAGSETARNVAPANTSMRPTRVGMRALGTVIAGSTSSSYSVFSGLLRGVLMDPGSSDYQPSVVLKLLGKSSPVPTDRITPIALPSGRQVVPMFGAAGDLKCLVSLAEEDWV